MSVSITLRFYEELNDFLAKKDRKKNIDYTLPNKTSIKDIIESFGIPHTEVDLILANGKSVEFSFIPKDGDQISIYPVFESLDISTVSKLRPEPLRTTRFILDVHLGKLAKLLRMYGFDTLYRNDYSDPEIIQIASNQKRIILTRDLGILKQNAVTHGYFVRSQFPSKQLKEIIQRFDLSNKVNPLSRCIHCNGEIKKVNKEDIIQQLKPRTQKYYHQFFQCSSCNKIYWEGSHFKQMMEKIKSK